MTRAKTMINAAFAETDVRLGGSRSWDIQVHHERFYSDLLVGGSLALGEGYMAGDWDCDDLDGMFCRVMRGRIEHRLSLPLLLPSLVRAKVIYLRNQSRTKLVAETHYDLGNDFYADMLGSRMQYTCAYFKDTDDLDAAQERKLDLVCRKLKLCEGERVLELGGGWGGFARFAAERYGCEVESYNISSQQVKFARELCKGLPVTIHHQDYREAWGTFDKVVSIGICEHIGRKNYHDFLAFQKARLKDDGLILLHTIGCNASKSTTDPWINKHIFPGGFLPSLEQLVSAANGQLVAEDIHNFGAHYDRTLMAWHARFEEAWPRHEARFGDRFRRMWRYYLLSCAGGFRARQLQLWQIVFSKDGQEGGYGSVR